ncbi:MAG: guanine deaminase [Clostridiales bacterium]|nr:guanine deaminase [Clostridiales bacterium]
MDSFIIKGDICWSKSKTELNTVRDGYLICEDGVCAGVFRYLPEKYAMLPMLDYSDKLVLPGMVDLHIHAPQYAFRGLGMDLELLDWLKTYTFPEEAKYAEREYAEKAYSIFVSRMIKSATTRAVIFATVHKDATILLMDKMEASGLISYVGKVNMDRDAPDDLREPGAEASAYDTFGWLNHIFGSYTRTKPILTPRFLPSCSETLLNELHEVQRAYEIPIQSHLSENPGEVELVRRLFPKTAFYAQGYEQFGLFGNSGKTVMAHCVYCTPEETELIRKNGVYVAHCPSSNMNLASGIAPVRKYLDMGIHVGLGSDVAAGESESVFRVIANAVQVSKLYWRMADDSCRPLCFEEAFWLATRGGGEFFGKAGSFDPGYEFDAVVLDDRDLFIYNDLTVEQRVQRDVYLGADIDRICAKFARGTRII